MALAVNDPKEIANALKPSIEETVSKAVTQPQRWDSDRWWE